MTAAAQPALPAFDPRRRRQLRDVDERLAVLARHLHRHRTDQCPHPCDYQILLCKADILLDRRLGLTR